MRACARRVPRSAHPACNAPLRQLRLTVPCTDHLDYPAPRRLRSPRMVSLRLVLPLCTLAAAPARGVTHDPNPTFTPSFQRKPRGGRATHVALGPPHEPRSAASADSSDLPPAVAACAWRSGHAVDNTGGQPSGIEPSRVPCEMRPCMRRSPANPLEGT